MSDSLLVFNRTDVGFALLPGLGWQYLPACGLAAELRVLLQFRSVCRIRVLECPSLVGEELPDFVTIAKHCSTSFLVVVYSAAKRIGVDVPGVGFIYFACPTARLFAVLALKPSGGAPN
jgi:hypothetical protein